MKKGLFIGVSLVIVAGLVYLGYVLRPVPSAQGSVIQGYEYYATTTGSATSGDTAGIKAAQVSNLKVSSTQLTTSGSLAQVTITGANIGTLTFFDATTTDVTKRTGNTATSSIILASFPPSTAAGTYTFDVAFSRGLIMTTLGTVPTTTVTWR